MLDSMVVLACLVDVEGSYGQSHTVGYGESCIDADAYCVSDPTSMIQSFEKPFAFWMDLPGRCAECKVNADMNTAICPKCGAQTDGNGKNVKWDKVWKYNNDVPPVQGGQLLIDIPKAWRIICIAHWMNQHSDFYYKHMFGDQDTWRVALAVVNNPDLWANLGFAPWIHPAFVIDWEHRWTIVHRCRSKLFDPTGIPPKYREKKLISIQQPHLPREKEVFELLSKVIPV